MTDADSTEHHEPPGQVLLRMQGITKRFFGVTVLDHVDLDCRRGEIHAVMGENGAGKSTLMKILVGAYQPDGGRISIDGTEVRFGHPRQALDEGVSIVHQELNLLPERTVAENIWLGREPRRRLGVDRRAMEATATGLLASLGAADVIAPRATVGQLPVAQQQLVEIAKALSFEPRILVLDEPTAALSPHEVDALFTRIRRLRDNGLTVLYISHRLKEIFELTDRITVLKDGRRVDTVETAQVEPRQLVRLMVGRELDHYFPPRATAEQIGPVRLALRGGSAGPLHDLDLELRAGEIVGLAGLAGSGRTELAKLLFGATRLATGTLTVDGRQRRLRSPRHAIRCGIGLLTEDRKSEGLVLPLSVRDNSLLAVRAMGSAGRRGTATPAMVRNLLDRVQLRGGTPHREVRYLSGGNQQKVVLAKWLGTGATVLIFDEPTRGIDVGAKASIHELMRELAAEGVAILMISSELPEVIGMADRILVMRQGTIAGTLPAGASEAEIMLLATGEVDPTGAADAAQVAAVAGAEIAGVAGVRTSTEDGTTEGVAR
ncbi:ribose transport system ATP-binding protein [Micromonospora pisi]|uniref:Ribose transport system ATP-binding protein n=1 Tax=Micromonospora pisi TaxID=589240 RepID=A0A495JVD5_9ACTN|nr:sugar ABC transporter ATP-binding protein [Micromonospora pisi]RKR92099.1 ribose transport system ATP-binding protein [Micromonospora pisi]